MAGRPPFDQFDAENQKISKVTWKYLEYFTTYDIADDKDNAAK